MSLLNLTPHSITLRNAQGLDTVIEPSGTVARVSTSSEVVGVMNGLEVIRTVYGDVEGLGTPQDHPNGVLVSGLVLGRLGKEWEGVAFAPATGPADNCIRNDKGHVVAVTKLVTV